MFWYKMCYTPIIYREDVEDAGVQLTPDMVNAQFPLIDADAVIHEEKHKKEWVNIILQKNMIPSVT